MPKLKFNAHFAGPPGNWRDHDEADPDDELLDKTPEDVVRLLGFDPLELEGSKAWDENAHPREGAGSSEGGRFTSGSGGGGSNTPETPAGTLSGLPDALHEPVSTFAKRYAQHPIEHAHGYDAEGKPLIRKHGDGNHVEFDAGETQAIKGARLFIHNHPGGCSFSADDIRFMGKQGIDSMMVIGLQGDKVNRYTMRVKDKTGLSDMDKCIVAQYSYKQKIDELTPEYRTRYYEGGATEELSRELWIEQTDRAWREVAHKHGLEYTREVLNA